MAEDIVVRVRVDKRQLAILKQDIADIQNGRIKIRVDGSGKEIQSIGDSAHYAGKQITLLNDTLSRVKWRAINMAISAVVSAFNQAISTMKAVDSALVVVQKTTGYTEQQLDALTEKAYELASAYGRTADEILNMSATFARAGMGDQLEEMTELSTLLQNVGDLESDTAAKFLLAANAAWQLGGDYNSLMQIIDGMNEVTNKAAVDMEALTNGITVAGSVFANAGESAQTFTGMLGAAVAATQRSGPEIARGLRYIAMSIRQIKGDLEDGEIIDEQSISDAAKALHSVGISVADAKGELRLTSDVLADLAGRWDSLTTAEQSYLAQSLAGKRQANVLTALMQNWSEVERQIALYADGAGSALRENEIYLDSWEAKSKKLTASWTEFVSHLIDTGVIKKGLDILTLGVEGLDTQAGKLVVTIGAAGVALYALYANPVLLGLGLVAAGLVAIGKASQDVSTQFRKQIDEISTLEEKYRSLTGAGSEYEELLKKAFRDSNPDGKDVGEGLIRATKNLTDAEKDRLVVLEAEAKAARDELAAKKEALYLDWQKAHTRQETKAYFGGYLITNEDTTPEAAEDAKNALSALNSEYEKTGNVVSYKEALQDLYNTLKIDAEALQAGADSGYELSDSGNEILDVYSEVNEKLKGLVAVGGELDSTLDNLTDGVDEQSGALRSAVDIYDEMKDKLGPLSDAMAQLTAQGYMDEAAMKALIAAYPDLESAITATADGFVISKEAIMENVLALWAEYSAINNNAASASMVQILALNNENGAWAANTAEIKKNIAARIAALEAEQLSTHLIGNGYSGTYYGESVGLTGAEANELSMLKGLLKSIDSYGTATATTGGSGGGGSGKSTTDTKLEALKDIVSLRKQELSYLTESGASEAQQISKMRQIQAALHDQAEYMRSIGASEEDVLKISTEWWTYQNKINKALDTTADLLKEAADAAKAAKEEAIAYVEQMASAATGPMQAQLDALNAQKDAIKDAEEEEEKLLAVEKARLALENAQNERKIRQYNARTGQWEFVADAQAVQKAREDLDDAQRQLNEYYRNRSISALEKNIKTIQGSYDLLKTAINDFAKEIEAGTLKYSDAVSYLISRMAGTGLESLAASMGAQIQQAGEQKIIDKMKANSDAWWSADEAGRKDLAAQNLLLGESQGWNRVNGTWYRADGTQLYDSGGILHGIGGIKATREDEMILPPDMTKALLNAESSGAFEAVLRHLGVVTSAGNELVRGMNSIQGNSRMSTIGSQVNNPVYIDGMQLQNVTMGTTIGELARQARCLSLHSA